MAAYLSRTQAYSQGREGEMAATRQSSTQGGTQNQARFAQSPFRIYVASGLARQECGSLALRLLVINTLPGSGRSGMIICQLWNLLLGWSRWHTLQTKMHDVDDVLLGALRKDWWRVCGSDGSREEASIACVPACSAVTVLVVVVVIICGERVSMYSTGTLSVLVPRWCLA